MSSQSRNADGISTNNIPIRTLYITPIKAGMEDQIKGYFDRFGTVKSVEMQQHNNLDAFFALVEFNEVGAAATALSSNDIHRIDGSDVHVEAAEPWHQPDHILNALDDDCLRLILLKLTLTDLTNAANVCVHFNQQAKSVFSTKHKALDLTKCTFQEAKYSMMTFGSVARSIDVESKYSLFTEDGYETEILSLIAQYCTPVLKDLTITAFSFERQLPNGVNFDAALSELDTLSLNDCCLQNSLNNLLSACGELKALDLDCCSQFAMANSNWCIPKFDKLEELHLSDAIGLSELFLNRVIILNPTVNVLSLSGRLERDIDLPEIIDTIAQNLPNFREFEFNVYGDFEKILRSLGRLTFLKVLKLDLNGRSTRPLGVTVLLNDIPIEHMQLFNGTIDTETILTYSQMQQLKVMELFDIEGLTDDHMIELAKGLGSKLEKLQLEGSTAKDLTTIGLKKMLPFAVKLSHLALKSATIVIDVDDYKKMLATVQKRREKCALLIELTGEGDQVEVDEAVLLENRDAFYIDEKNSILQVDYDDSSTNFDSHGSSDSDDDDYYENSGYRTPYSDSDSDSD